MQLDTVMKKRKRKIIKKKKNPGKKMFSLSHLPYLRLQ